MYLESVSQFRIKKFASKRNEAKRDPFHFLFKRSSENLLIFLLLFDFSFHLNINHLCTYDLYGPGGLALEISSFVGPCEIA
jgi:hypothetical protein